MAKTFDGKVALVTGAGSGIGRASAMAFAQEGAKVTVADVVVSGGEETVGMIKAAGGRATFVKADVSDAAEVKALIAETVKIYGRLDFAHNNAGIGFEVKATTTDTTEETWDRVMGINLKGLWFCMKFEIPEMLKQGGGAIVNTASVAGLIGPPGYSAYVASKHGVIGLTKTAAMEYAKAGIRINAICPAAVRTPQLERMIGNMIGNDPLIEKHINEIQPIGRMGRPEEIAAVVVWLCSDAASLVTGLAMPVDGGQMAH